MAETNLIHSQGFSIGRWRFLSFALCRGECLTLCLPSAARGDYDRIVACLTGTELVPGLDFRSSVVFARPAAVTSGWRRWLSDPTPFDWLKRNTTLSDDAIQAFLREHNLDRRLPLSHYAGSPRMLLGLAAAYAQRPSVVAFSTSGLDPTGVRAVFRMVAEHLPECSALYVAWPYLRDGQQHYDNFPGSRSVIVVSSEPSASANLRNVKSA